MQKFTTLTAQQRAAFDQAYVDTDQALADAILLLRKKIILTANPQEEKQLQPLLDSLKAQRDAIDAEYDAITFDGFDVASPTPAQVQTISDLAQKVAALTDKADRARDAAVLAQNALAVYSKLKG